jgi:hypothetical protein
MGVFVNPLVRISYTPAAHDAQNSFGQAIRERLLGQFIAWAYDIRDFCLGFRLNWYVKRRRENIRNWEKKHGQEEVGGFCLIDQMQILTPWGWAHI